MKIILPTMKNILCCVAILLNLIVTQSYAQAQDNDWYNVEFIVFQQLNPQALSAEVWQGFPPLPSVDNAIILKPTKEEDTTEAYELLPQPQWQLREVAEKINRDGDYELLFHQAWRQPIDNTHASTQNIHIFAKPIAAHQVLGQMQTAGYSLEETLVKSLPFDTWKLNGTMSLSKHNYFQIDTDLILRLSPKEQRQQYTTKKNRSTDKTLSVRINENRRLSQDELYYLDHPLFGALIMVTVDKDQS